MKRLAPMFIALFTASLFAEEPRTVRIIASPETTYFTAHQLPDGRIDYRTHFNNLHSEGVSPEENVIVALFTWLAGEMEKPLLRAAAEGKELDAEMAERIHRYRERFWRELDFEAPPDWKNLQFGFFPFDDPTKNSEMLREQWEKARTALWTADDFPDLAEGIKETDEITQKLLASLQRTRYFHPYFNDGGTFNQEGADSDLLVFTSLPYVQTLREPARFLQFRGNWDFAKGNIDQAFECAFASVRLGNTIRSGAGMTVEDLVGIAIAGIGRHQLVVYLANIDGKKDADWILRKKREYEALNRMPDTVPTSNLPNWNIGERLFALDTVQAMATRRYAMADLFEGIPEVVQTFSETFESDTEYDWNAILRRCNLFFDDYDESLMIPDYVRRLRALERLDIRVREYRERYETERDATRRAGDLILGELTPAMVAVELARGRAEWLHQCTQVAFALAAYRAEHHGEHPDGLEQLVPRHMEAVPNSPFTGGALPYINRADVCFFASTDKYKFDGSDAEVERVLSETAPGYMGIIYPEAHSRHFIFVIWK